MFLGGHGGAGRDLTLGGFLSAAATRTASSAISSCPWAAPSGRRPLPEVRAFPARSFLRFFENHGWLTLSGAPPWWTMRGGAGPTWTPSPADSAEKSISRPVEAVRRSPHGVTVSSGGGEWRFDRIVIAAHADRALRLLADPSPDERRLLGAFRYSRNRAVLHADREALPRATDAWASWNSDLVDCRDDAAPVSLTYHMNRLQGLPGPDELSVTLNPARDPERVLAAMESPIPSWTGRPSSPRRRSRSATASEAPSSPAPIFVTGGERTACSPQSRSRSGSA